MKELVCLFYCHKSSLLGNPRKVLFYERATKLLFQQKMDGEPTSLYQAFAVQQLLVIIFSVTENGKLWNDDG